MSIEYKVAVLRARKGVSGVGRRLAQALDAYEVTCHNVPAERLHPECVVINYGRSEWPEWWKNTYKMINYPESVYKCVHKIITLQELSKYGIPCVQVIYNFEEAKSWIEHGYRVFCRTTETGKQGNGIVLAAKLNELVTNQLVLINGKVMTICFYQDSTTADRGTIHPSYVQIELPKETLEKLKKEIILSPDLLEYFYQASFPELDSTPERPGARRIPSDGFIMLDETRTNSIKELIHDPGISFNLQSNHKSLS